ncbi:ABC transporter permease [Halobacteria archaeon AArc-m2/3/4]|uniref:ABC transporter permease n=1 Tax=Natronoglomus mannanivorans TaxID=2979990 RepID=A0ABT2QL67_9EURY|nr:ABC transporter permease [Halobacteria archaeon AArc-m2/3/4]
MLEATVLERLGIALASITTAILVGLLAVTASGYNPVLFLNNLIVGSIGSERVLARTLRLSTFFVLTGVAVAIAFRAGVFNIGVQGQFIVGGICCTMSILWAAPLLPNGTVGGIVLMLLGTVAAAIGGGLYGALPGVLKAYADANEIITTIMLNFIAIGVVSWLITNPFRAEGATNVRTESLPDNVGLPPIVFGDSGFSVIGLALTLVLVAVVAVVMTRTRSGYDMVTSGYQASAAVYSGVDAKRTIVTTMTFSGAVAGIASALYVIMFQGNFIEPASIHTYGYDAIAVSLLAANNPVGVIPAGLLFGGLNSSGSYIQTYSDVPVQLIDGIVGLVIVFVAAPELFRMAAKRTGLGGDDE